VQFAERISQRPCLFGLYPIGDFARQRGGRLGPKPRMTLAVQSAIVASMVDRLEGKRQFLAAELQRYFPPSGTAAKPWTKTG